MPDYSSTAQALSRPHSRSPSISPNLEQQQERQERQDRPAWSRISSSARRPNNTSPYSSTSKPTSFIDQALRTSAHVQRKILSAFQRLTLLQQCLAVIAAVAAFVGGVLFLIYNEKIFAALGPVAKQWRQLPGGWVIVWLLTFICAFPPLIGYSSAVTISGFVYGFPNGWFIVSTATVVGSLASFVASRTVLSGYVHGLVGKDKRFEALALTLKHDGLKILCMIRFCPLPYSLSNAAMSTFPTVHPLSFALATLIASPKLLIHVFIGSRMAAIAESNEKMDFTTKMVNYASIAVGVTVGTGLGFYIYQRTIARAKELEREELEAAGGEAGLVRGGGYDDELDVDAAALMNDDDISLWDNDDIANAAYRDEFSDGSDQDEQKAKASR